MYHYSLPSIRPIPVLINHCHFFPLIAKRNDKQAGYFCHVVPKKTQFLYQVDCATSKAGFCDILKKLAQNLPWTKPMEFIESILKPYQLQKAWFSEWLRFILLFHASLCYYL